MNNLIINLILSIYSSECGIAFQTFQFTLLGFELALFAYATYASYR